MSNSHIERILRALRYSKSKPPTYKDRFWKIRELIGTCNANMKKVFAPRWATCLNEAMSPWTDKYNYASWSTFSEKTSVLKQ